MSNLNAVLEKIITIMVNSPELGNNDKKALCRIWAEYIEGCKRQQEILDRLQRGEEP